VSDDLEMKAIAEHVPLDEAAPGAIAAGVDALLVCHRAEVQHRAIDLVRRAVEDGRIARARIAEARGRIAALLRYAGPAPDPALARARLRSAAHLALAARIPPLASGRDPTVA
jgi:beta-N-acetylhexosaminidase